MEFTAIDFEAKKARHNLVFASIQPLLRPRVTHWSHTIGVVDDCYRCLDCEVLDGGLQCETPCSAHVERVALTEPQCFDAGGDDEFGCIGAIERRTGPGFGSVGLPRCDRHYAARLRERSRTDITDLEFAQATSGCEYDHVPHTTADFMSETERQDMRDAGRGHLVF